VIALGRSQRARGGGRDLKAGVAIEDQPENGLGRNRVGEERLARQRGGEFEVRVIVGSMSARDRRRYAAACLHLAEELMLRMPAALAMGKAVAHLG
jgi:hypothetical protein